MLEGNYDYDKNPMAPPGTQVMVHAKPQQRRSWGPYAIDGWYLAPAVKHYRCFKVYIPSTGKERVSDTIEFIKPTQSSPMIEPRSLLIDAATTIIKAVSNPLNKMTQYKEEQLDALKVLATCFQNAARSLPPQPTSTSNIITRSSQRVPLRTIPMQKTLQRVPVSNSSGLPT